MQRTHPAFSCFTPLNLLAFTPLIYYKQCCCFLFSIMSISDQTQISFFYPLQLNTDLKYLKHHKRTLSSLTFLCKILHYQQPDISTSDMKAQLCPAEEVRWLCNKPQFSRLSIQAGISKLEITLNKDLFSSIQDLRFFLQIEVKLFPYIFFIIFLRYIFTSTPVVHSEVTVPSNGISPNLLLIRLLLLPTEVLTMWKISERP